MGYYTLKQLKEQLAILLQDPLMQNPLYHPDILRLKLNFAANKCAVLSHCLPATDTTLDTVKNTQEYDTKDLGGADSYIVDAIKQVYYNEGTNAIRSVVATPTAGGSAYVVDDVLTVVQSGASGGTVTVTAVSAGGVVTEIELTTVGEGYAIAKGVATSGGAGTGCTIEIDDIDTEWGELDETTILQLDQDEEGWRDEEAGTPDKWYWDGKSKIGVYPKPDTTGTNNIKIYYYQKIVLDLAEDVCYVPAEYIPEVVDHAFYTIMGKRELAKSIEVEWATFSRHHELGRTAHRYYMKRPKRSRQGDL